MIKTEETPVRILHILLSLGVGGAEKLVYDMTKELDPNRYEVVLCSLQFKGPLEEAFIKDGVKVYYKKRKPGIDLPTIKWLRNIIIEEKIDVIHAHQYTPYFFAFLSSLFLSNVKLVYTEHGRHYPDRVSIKRYIFNPIFAAFTDHIISISESTKRSMVTYDNFPSKKISIILNGVKCVDQIRDVDITKKRRSIGLDEKGLVIGMAARLDSIKNISMTLRAFSLITQKRRDCFLVIAGTGELGGKLKEEAIALGISDRVKFIGLRMDLPEIYRLFDVFILSSFTEGLSITLIEAMANAIPTVVTEVGGNPEVVIDGKTGYLVPLNDDLKMAEKILILLNDPKQAKEMGGKGRERINEIFSFGKMLNQYIKLYEKKG